MTSGSNVLGSHEYQNKCELSNESFVSLATRDALVQTSCCGRRYERLKAENYIHEVVGCPGCKDPSPKLTAVVIGEIASETFGKTSSSLDSIANIKPLDLIECVAINDISAISAITNLKPLDLRGCVDISDIIFSSLKDLTILTKLDLKLYDKSIIADLKSFEKLVKHTSKQVDPTKHFTRYIKFIGLDAVNEAIKYINPAYPIYSVGSGTAALEEYIAQQTGIKVICIDPDPDSWSGGHPIIRKPEYKYLKDVPEIPEHATLLLVAPTPGDSTYDMEAIQAHKWEQIIIIGDKNHGAIGYKAKAWLNEVYGSCDNDSDSSDNDNDDEEPVEKRDMEYSLKYQSTREVYTIANSGFDKMIYEIAVLEKGFRGEAIINKKNKIVENFEIMSKLLDLPFDEFQKFYR